MANEETMNETIIPLKGMRGVIASNMMKSLSNSAQLTLHMQADISDLEPARQKYASDQNSRITITDILIKATAEQLKKHPGVNGWINESQIQLVHDIHIGMAVAIPGGLIVPVLRDAGEKRLLELSGEAKELAEKAKTGKLKPVECTGSTFTITNLGAMGVIWFTPIINRPEIGILGVGAAQTVPVFDSDSSGWKPRLMLPLSLTFNHCAIDGAPAAAFLRDLCISLGQVSPEQL